MIEGVPVCVTSLVIFLYDTGLYQLHRFCTRFSLWVCHMFHLELY